MLGFLPDPAAGELVYSIVARYGAMLGGSDGRALVQRLFGLSANTVAVDLPAGLAHFAARSRNAFEAESLIADHTIYPYLFRFAPAGHVERARAWLLQGGGRRPPRIGVRAAAFPVAEHLAFCPACMRGDGAAGLSAWRREHQLPGVLVCPHHGTPLLVSQVARGNRRGLDAFVCLTPDIARNAEARAVPRRHHRYFLDFAQASARLLEVPFEASGLAALQERLRDLLHEYRWSRAPSLIASSELASRFARHPRIGALMAAIGVRWTDHQIAVALNRLLYRNDVAKHPALVLMVLEIAGASVTDLFAPAPPVASQERRAPAVRTKPAPRSDLPCGNPACPQHQGAVAPQLAASGVAECVRGRCPECGFTYRWHPCRPREAVLVESAPSWDTLLVQVLSDHKVSIRAASRRLEVSVSAVMRHARRLGLWREKWKDRPKVQLRLVAKPARLLAQHRQAWLEYRASGIQVPTKRMPRSTFAAYRYLMRHDRAWMGERGQERQ